MKGLTGLVLGIGLTTGALFGGNAVYNHYTSPEYARAKELDRAVETLLERKWNREGQEHYVLDNGSKVTLYFKHDSNSYLCFLIDDKVSLFSESWESSPDGDGRKFASMKIQEGDKNAYFHRAEIKDADAWQKRYEEILLECTRKKREYVESLEKLAKDTVLKTGQTAFGKKTE